MSGHNRWTKIKRKKEAMGATKGALFTKLIREVTVAARNGGGDPEHNARLRSAVLAAREANMPNETIQRAVKKGTGELEGVSYEEMVYEGYGPGGVAIGIIPVKVGSTEDQVMELALDAGADDVVSDEEGGFEVRTEIPALLPAYKALEKKLSLGAPKMVYLPKTMVQVTGDAADKVVRLVETLEENDDVQHVYTNAEFDDRTVAELESRA
ncbi:MAG: YebC/PmpR family DNA-binding transcriptional regulator [Deltaproteobacteria bacterium]|nr:MAG: YebC/PmpR family DNA-binding transcriptional regulator [Deltaproteobacteria bacterium]